MKLNIDKFDAQGYLHLEDVIPEQPLRVARRDCINLKKEYIKALMSKISLFKNQNNTNIKIFYIRE